MHDLDLERSMTEQLPLDRTIFKGKDGTVRCTKCVRGLDRTFIDGKGQRMDGDVGAFKGILKLWWHGHWWEVPSLAAFQEWTMDSICETPDGEAVEPDHPDSWLSLAQLV